jgi:hypothetical protein
MPRQSVAGEIWSDAFPPAPQAPTEWIWEGLIKPRSLTLLTSQWKAGKTTLLSILLGLRVAGGSLGGLAVKPGNTLIITEEPIPDWEARAAKHHFGDNVSFISKPFRTIPTEKEWQELLDRALTIHTVHGVDLFLIDPLAPFLRNENQARCMLEALLPLDKLLQVGMAGTLLHHPGRGERPLGQAARGSGALLGHVDVSIDMRLPPGEGPDTRRRQLFALSRYPPSPRRLTMELDETGTIYTLVPSRAQAQADAAWEVIRLILAEAPQKLTRQDIINEWPPDAYQPCATTVWSRLGKAVEDGLVLCEGSGSKSDPFRYWLLQREAVWAEDPFYALMEAQRQQLGLPFESLTERKEKLRQAGEITDGPADGAD